MLWDQTLAAGQTFTFSFTAAGAYTYHCAIHTFMTASISIAPIAKPSSGAAGTTFKIVVATVGAVAPFVYDIQRKVGGGAFKDWKIGITNRSVKFVSTKAKRELGWRAAVPLADGLAQTWAWTKEAQPA